MRPKIRILCLPDVDRAIGGVKQFIQACTAPSRIGLGCCCRNGTRGFRPSWFQSEAVTFSLEECQKRGDFDPTTTIIVLPETYISANLSSFWGLNLSDYARVVFNQNAYYSYGANIPDLRSKLALFYDHPNLLHVLCVSEDTHHFLRTNIGLNDQCISRIINAIEPMFTSEANPSNRFHWMPRKILMTLIPS